MPTCETCGNACDKAFQVTLNGSTHTFDSFECAIQVHLLCSGARKPRSALAGSIFQLAAESVKPGVDRRKCIISQCYQHHLAERVSALTCSPLCATERNIIV